MLFLFFWGGGQNFTWKCWFFVWLFWKKWDVVMCLLQVVLGTNLETMLDAMRCGQFPTATAPWQSELDSWRIDTRGVAQLKRSSCVMFLFYVEISFIRYVWFPVLWVLCFLMRILEPFTLWIRFEKKTHQPKKKNRRSFRTAVAEPQTCPFFHLLIFKNVSSCKKKSTCGRNHT